MKTSGPIRIGECIARHVLLPRVTPRALGVTPASIDERINRR
jgi:hypothetical protein